MTVDIDALGFTLRNTIESIVLSDRSDNNGLFAKFRAPAFTFIEEIFRSTDPSERDRRQRLRLKLALHLAPPSAISYSPTNPIPRWRLIQEHLERHLGRVGFDVEFLAKEVAATLKSWQEDRQSVGQYKTALLRRDGDLCQSCYIEFGSSAATSLATNDPYKPYLGKDPSAPMNRATVDHIVPVSGFGSNDFDNLQLLCELCNQGKGSLDPPLLKHEFMYAAKPISEIPWWHRAKLLYFTLEAREFRCSVCDERSELTIRKVIEGGAIVSTNLTSKCYECIMPTP